MERNYLIPQPPAERTDETAWLNWLDAIVAFRLHKGYKQRWIFHVLEWSQPPRIVWERYAEITTRGNWPEWINYQSADYSGFWDEFID